ncbi:MAG: PAS domain-containing protein [Deltaproteobacteria bacterium]|nr:PAS domain-containing protein [Deltaproteobacteria bacterium]
MADDLKAIERLGKVFFDSYFVVDRERRIIDFNEGFVQLLGLRPAQRRTLKGTHCYKMLSLDICKDHCIALECVTRGAPVRKEEIHGKGPNERELVLELSAIPLANEANEITGVFVTHRDVTDERRLKTRYLAEQEAHGKERDTLLRIIKEREEELEELRRRDKLRRP